LVLTRTSRRGFTVPMATTVRGTNVISFFLWRGEKAGKSPSRNKTCTYRSTLSNQNMQASFVRPPTGSGPNLRGADRSPTPATLPKQARAFSYGAWERETRIAIDYWRGGAVWCGRLPAWRIKALCHRLHQDVGATAQLHRSYGRPSAARCLTLIFRIRSRIEELLASKP
jgi:hypothetical protein